MIMACQSMACRYPREPRCSASLPCATLDSCFARNLYLLVMLVFFYGDGEAMMKCDVKLAKMETQD